MVAQRTAEAYVLRTLDLGEADRIAVLVSADEGRIEGVARRARSLRGGFGAALEPLTLVRVTYRERPGRDLVSLDRVEIVESSFGLLSTPESLGVFSHLAELAAAVTMAGEGHPRLVRLLGAVLGAAREADAAAGIARAARRAGHVAGHVAGRVAEARGDGAYGARGERTDREADRVAEARAGERADDLQAGTRLALLRLYFDVWVARLEGFWPELLVCAACGKTLTGARRVGVHTGGALCLACARGSAEGTLPLGAAGAALAGAVLRDGPRELLAAHPAAASAGIAELGRVADALLTVHLERQLRTVRVPHEARVKRDRA